MEFEGGDGDGVKDHQDVPHAVEQTVKIKKKARMNEEDDDDEGDVGAYVDPSNDPLSTEHIQAQAKARKDLVDLLVKKGFDAKAADDYQIHVRPTKGKARRSDGLVGGYSFTYTGPDGSHLVSKSDVLSAIQDRLGRRNSNASARHSMGTKAYVPRFQAVENARSRYAQQVDDNDLPLIATSIKVYNFGHIDTRSGFHSPVYLYPVGYRCEQTVSGTTFHKGVTSQKIVCEIGETEGFPEFRIFVQATGTTYIASTEQAVFKKFMPGSADTEFPSFFNLEVELLIEGLDEADQCDEYIFHEERGYGERYTDEADAKVVRKEVLTKADREKRTAMRQRAKHFSRDEQDREAELRKRNNADEDKLSYKHNSAMEKEKKEHVKEEMKKRKAQQREEDKLLKDERRKRDLQQRESLKELESQRKEALKQSEKALRERNKKTLGFRREVVKEIKANRTTAQSTVVEIFDSEIAEDVQTSVYPEIDEVLPTGSPSEILDGQSGLKEFIPTLPSLPPLGDGKHAQLYGKDDNWDEVLGIAMTLHMYGKTMGLDDRIPLASLVTALTGQASSAVLEALSNTPPQGVLTGEAEVSAISASEDADPSAASTNEVPAEPRTRKDGILDRIQLSITKLLSGPLHSLMDLDQRESGDSRRDRRLAAVRYPLNQLTWTEVARMECLSYLFSQPLRSHEDVRLKEDLQHLLRGSKQSSFRIAKNIVRNIRYRWFMRMRPLSHSPQHEVHFDLYSTQHGGANRDGETDMDCEDQLEAMVNTLAVAYQPRDYVSSVRTITAQQIYQQARLHDLQQERSKQRPLFNHFNTDQELLDSLRDLSEDSAQYTVTYRRCMKVLLKVLQSSAAKNFFWEVDQEAYVDYYTTITRPMMLVNVASNLVTKAYDPVALLSPSSPDESDDKIDNGIAYEFYKDLQQVAFNCIVYNSEISPFVSQAQKLLQVVHRHVHRWVLSIHSTSSKTDDGHKAAMSVLNGFLPPIDLCSEKFCLLTATPINYNQKDDIKCGKCQGCFNLTALEHIYTDDLYDQGVWNSIVDRFPGVDMTEVLRYFKQFYVHPTKEIISQVNEEWHCPFCLQEDSCVVLGAALREGLSKDNLFTLNEWGPSALVPWLLHPGHGDCIETLQKEQPHLLTVVDTIQILSNTALSPFAVTVEQPGQRAWTTAERIRVLQGLCMITRESQTCNQHLQTLSKVCVKLMELCNNPKFRQGEFLTMVRQVAGEQGVIICKRMLHELYSEADTPLSYTVADMLKEGKCMICNAATYYEESAQVLLCDGCNAEAHLSCLHIDDVPHGEWYCEACVEKQKMVQGKEDEQNIAGNMDVVRSKEVEEELINKCAEIKAEGGNPFLFGPDEVKCQYCGFTEKELCSPLVIGMTRAEHDAYVQSCQPATVSNEVLYGEEDKKQGPTSVVFSYEDEILPNPTLSYPYMARYLTKAGKLLQQEHEKRGVETIIAHELCALNMFHARVNSFRHTLRRQRKAVAKKAISMCGINILPLGQDDHRHVYYKFPFSADLFVQYGGVGNLQDDQDQKDFNKLIHKAMEAEEQMDLGSLSEHKHWVRIHDIEVMKKIVAVLGSSYNESMLRSNIVNEVLGDRLFAGDTETLITTNSMDVAAEAKPTDTAINAEEKDAEYLASPANLRLNASKGVDIQSDVLIPEEKVYEDDAANEGEEDEEQEEAVKQYFTFSNRKYYAVALTTPTGSTAKMAKLHSKYNLRVVYYIYRQGVAEPLSMAVLDEPWEDNLYYFSAIQFKRSGVYIVCFAVEGSPMAANIPPLIYTITVHANKIKCGILDAIDNLRAKDFIHEANRSITVGRRELLSHTHANVYNQSEGHAVKACLWMVFLSLPLGALQLDADPTASELDQLLEPVGWNGALEMAWKDALISADTPGAVMECLIVLEQYVQRGWLVAPQARLLSSLPNAHFAVRCATYSSVALRIYCLDRALAYSKVTLPPRERRGAAVEDDDEPRRAGRSRDIAAPAARRPSTDPAESSGRVRRSAAAAASQRIQQSSSRRAADEGDDDDDEDAGDAEMDEDDDDDDENESEHDSDVAARGAQSHGATAWTCAACEATNEARARSCVACGGRKPPAAVAAPSRDSRAVKRAKKRGRGSDDEDEDDDSGRDVRARRSSGRRSATANVRSYREASDDDDEEAEFDAKPRPKRPKKVIKDDDDEDDEDEDEEGEEDDQVGDEAEEDEGAPEASAEAVQAFTQRLVAFQPMGRDVSVRALSVLRSVLRDGRSSIFWQPVDLRAVPDYTTWVDTPMDLGTITERIYTDSYQDRSEDILKDIHLVWSNCKTYNSSDSILYQYADQLGEDCDRRWQEWVVAESRPQDPLVLGD